MNDEDFVCPENRRLSGLENGKDHQRGWRRFQRQRIMLARKDYWSGDPPDGYYGARRLGMLSKTPRPCSCPGCGNPRRHFGDLTIQEEKFMESFWSQMLTECVVEKV